MLGNSNPHDVWDEFIEKKGGGDVMEAIFPVARTENREHRHRHLP